MVDQIVTVKVVPDFSSMVDVLRVVGEELTRLADRFEALGQAADGAAVGVDGLVEAAAPKKVWDRRDPGCVERWPGCGSGLYDQRCCRFPKSCSAGDVGFE